MNGQRPAFAIAALDRLPTMATNFSTASTSTLGQGRPSFSPPDYDTSSLTSVETPKTSLECTPYDQYTSTQAQPSRDSCDRRRQTEKDSSRLVEMPAQLVGQTVTPFLREHIPEIYAPIGKPEMLTMEITPNRDQNSKFCYRHRPDSKCRRAADENKMSMIQRVSVFVPFVAPLSKVVSCVCVLG
jgi:hypothetical protein